jgi:hypothetical protein
MVSGGADGLGRSRDGLGGPVPFLFFEFDFQRRGATASKNASFLEMIAQRRLPPPSSENGFQPPL